MITRWIFRYEPEDMLQWSPWLPLLHWWDVLMTERTTQPLILQPAASASCKCKRGPPGCVLCLVLANLSRGAACLPGANNLAGTGRWGLWLVSGGPVTLLSKPIDPLSSMMCFLQLCCGFSPRGVPGGRITGSQVRPLPSISFPEEDARRRLSPLWVMLARVPSVCWLRHHLQVAARRGWNNSLQWLLMLPNPCFFYPSLQNPKRQHLAPLPAVFFLLPSSIHQPLSWKW